ncbi:253_t:CDS:2 [Entrophospora sp. SA101]|nr:253_t:CDS:2 [Entrophospora sp. SA101]
MSGITPETPYCKLSAWAYRFNYANSTLIDDAIKLPVYWDRHQIELGISNAVIIISMFYNDFANQETLLNACICKGVALFITWDSGMELETYVKDKQCPRTRLHKKLLEYKNLTANQPDHMYWILFQVGIFDEEILRHDVSTITTAFNNPKQSIFLNITVKDELAQLVVEAIISKKLLADRNYVIGDFVSHTYLGHVYQVVNHGALFDENMPAEIGEFETSNKLRLSGIVSARPLPRILYPGCKPELARAHADHRCHFQIIRNLYLPDSKKSGRPPNSIWRYFDKGNERFPGKYDASCKYCNDRSSCGSPQLMEEHLANNCANVPVEVKNFIWKLY